MPPASGALVEVVTIYLLGGPATTLKAEEVVPVKPLLAAVRVYPLPTLLTDKSEKVAIPLTALAVTVPDKTPDPGLLVKVKVTLLVALVTVLNNASPILTVTAGLILAPAVTLAGGFVLMLSLDAVPTYISNWFVVTCVRPGLVAT